MPQIIAADNPPILQSVLFPYQCLLQPFASIDRIPKTGSNDSLYNPKSNKQYDFVEQQKVAEIAESWFIQYSMKQQAKGIIESFDDVRNVKEYQDKDVDFVYHYRNRPPVMIEVKGDRHELRNLFAETVVPSFYTDKETGNVVDQRAKPGWLFGSKADFVFYCFIRFDTIYILNLRRFSPWLCNCLATKGVRNKFTSCAAHNLHNIDAPSDNFYYGMGCLVPLSVLESVEERLCNKIIAEPPGIIGVYENRKESENLHYA